MSALAFDPYAALADIENGQGLRANRASGANPGPILARLAPLALSPAQNSNPRALLPVTALDPIAWVTALSSFEASRPPGGIALDRWRILLADARWLARSHGEAAAAFGWSASGLFGIDPMPGWGGVADRLEGARCLAFTASVAHWQGNDCEGWLWRRTLTPKPLLWELAQ